MDYRQFIREATTIHSEEGFALYSYQDETFSTLNDTAAILKLHPRVLYLYLEDNNLLRLTLKLTGTNQGPIHLVGEALLGKLCQHFQPELVKSFLAEPKMVGKLTLTTAEFEVVYRKSRSGMEYHPKTPELPSIVAAKDIAKALGVHTQLVETALFKNGIKPHVHVVYTPYYLWSEVSCVYLTMFT